MIWIIVAALILFLLSNCLLASSDESLDVEPQPFVSDQTFCDLLPDVPEEIALKVRQVLVDVSGWEREEIHPDTRLVEFEIG